MSRNFSGAAVNTPRIDLGNINETGHTVLSEEVVWTAGAFFRSESDTTDQQAIISKWSGDDAASQRWVQIRVGTGATGAIEIMFGNAVRLTGSTDVSRNTWYLVSFSCDGTGILSSVTDATITMYLVGMDGTVIDDGLTTTSTPLETGTGETRNVTIGGRPDDGGDPFDGDIAFAFYIRDRELTRDEVLAYLRNPLDVLMAYADDLVFFHELGFGDPEPDLSRRGNNGTLLNSPTVGGHPPVGATFARLGDLYVPTAAATPVDTAAFVTRRPNPLLRM